MDWVRMRKVFATAAVVASVAGLTACTEEQAYCVDLAGFAAAASEVDPTNAADYGTIVDDAKKIGATAPAEVKDDWQKVIAFAEKAKAANGNRVEMARLSQQTAGVTKAYKAIATHAKDACKVDVPNLN
ncbi:hypothetical protein OG394_01950 [Kribbella sp. NBC_01245]|uniref:hypothetical protein n=1 Tax=Kribbella sp. NBC_01245 TaxID=2903578 RepID=UPI002E2CEF77|nr:hypothetical protein [Kribbella sp. NBC_01245]